MNNLLFSLVEVGAGIYNGLNTALGSVGFLILVNLIGVVAIVIKITETQNKNRNKIIFFAMMGALCWTIYFVLHGDFTSAGINIVGAIQLLIFSQREKHKWANSKFWLFFFLAVQVGLGIIIWRNWFSIVVIIAGLLGTIAYFIMNVKVYRYLFATLITLWIANGIVNGYIIALIHDIFAFISIIIAIVRYNVLGKEKTQKIQQESK
jgi:hypothetical protein